jgi:hypothetical protein
MKNALAARGKITEGWEFFNCPWPPAARIEGDKKDSAVLIAST